ncbi:hypothetical protein HGA64_04530 [Candidatus Falkowbacteria bacterium]|nr:hypothetical protein [Candidatus Falkowbacteria bacterium]
MKARNLKQLKIYGSAVLLLFLLVGCGQQAAQKATPTPSASKEQNQQQSKTSQGQPEVMVANNPSLGKILTDGKGMTLYTFTNDSKGTSTCYADCATSWPPLTADGLPKIADNLIANKFGIITRVDGSKQVTYEGMPLYYWFKDVKPGDATGQGVGGVWFVYKVASDDLSTSTATSTAK